MTHSAIVWAHLQSALLLFALIALLPEKSRMAGPIRLGGGALVLALSLLPLGHIDLSAYLYAYSGQLSLPSLALLLHFVFRRIYSTELLGESDRRLLIGGGTLLALPFYVMALGIGLYDPYNLGFNALALPGAVGIAVALAWLTLRRGSAIVLLAALWAWLLGAGQSANLWDYLFDAWLLIGGLAWAAARIRKPTHSAT